MFSKPLAFVLAASVLAVSGCGEVGTGNSGSGDAGSQSVDLAPVGTQHSEPWKVVAAESVASGTDSVFAAFNEPGAVVVAEYQGSEVVRRLEIAREFDPFGIVRVATAGNQLLVRFSECRIELGPDDNFCDGSDGDGRYKIDSLHEVDIDSWTSDKVDLPSAMNKLSVWISSEIGYLGNEPVVRYSANNDDESYRESGFLIRNKSEWMMIADPEDGDEEFIACPAGKMLIGIASTDKSDEGATTTAIPVTWRLEEGKSEWARVGAPDVPGISKDAFVQPQCAQNVEYLSVLDTDAATGGQFTDYYVFAGDSLRRVAHFDRVATPLSRAGRHLVVSGGTQSADGGEDTSWIVSDVLDQPVHVDSTVGGSYRERSPLAATDDLSSVWISGGENIEVKDLGGR